MKKIIQIFSSFVFLLSLAACAPKTNQNTSNTVDHTTDPTPYAVYETFTLYFPNMEQSHLTKEDHEIRIQDDTDREKLILDALKMGPKDDRLASPLSPDAKINSIKTISGLCTIDFSENFLNTTDESVETANLMLHSIVQSLCELDTIQEVKFNVEGNTTAKVNEEIDLSQPITSDTANI